LQQLLGSPGIALFGPNGTLLAALGPHSHHCLDEQVAAAAAEAVRTGRRQLATCEPCYQPGCAVTRAVVAPLPVAGSAAGALAVGAGTVIAPYLVRATDETARFVGTQLELAELDQSRADLARAEVRALRAQISPHFLYNALSTIAAFVRSDPDRARDLLVEFADFTRYSFRETGEFTSLAAELGNIDRYLTLERARFGDRLQVRVRVAPEVLGVAVPFLAIQPLVENAVRHGLAGRPRGGTVTLTAEDVGTDCVISVEDDGIGMDPDLVGREQPDAGQGTHVGLGNVDDRLRAAFGADYGLVVETAPGAGTKVIVRVPKFAPGVAADR
jgi:two-component system LytT family sensor kinase